MSNGYDVNGGAGASCIGTAMVGDSRPHEGSGEWLDQVFRYHAPTAAQVAEYTQLREIAKLLVSTIIRTCPACADRTAAIRKVREAVMMANASIALRGLA